MNFVDSHLEMISYVSKSAEFPSRSLKECLQTREIYTTRAALEREYAGKLQGLARKFSEKKAKMGTSFVIGNEPNKSWDLSTVLRQRWVTYMQIVFENQRNILRQYYSSTLNGAYDQIITSIVDSAQDHIKLADEFNSQVVDVLKGVERKNEEAKKKVSRK